MSAAPIYLDYNATTPVDPAVLDAMLPYLQGEFGNPSSAHGLGGRAHDAVEAARAEVAALIGAVPDEIVFTSGGTEASNIAIRGAVRIDAKRRAVVTSMIEHPATEACCAFLEGEGHKVTRVPAQADGLIDPARVATAIDDDTALVTIIHAQNEIGTIQPIKDIAAAARRRGALVHVDAAQSVGKIAVDVEEFGADLLSIAGHKLYAPKGVGVLYVRRGTAVPPLLLGAGQERGRRPGTENVPYIVALGEACRIAGALLEREATRLSALAGELFAALKRDIPGIVLVGHPTRRLPNTLNVLFPDASGRQVLEQCPRVMASTGSACHAGSEEPSAILTALGIVRGKALGAVRLSLGRSTKEDDIAAAARALAQAWQRVASAVAAAE
ncbi:MAG TPA: cysteine desulfurase family protein [Xanthobacteraceae bacterium]|nr:cysteine desulfurase family protein [Xanthobacteraceae bacterium]